MLGEEDEGEDGNPEHSNPASSGAAAEGSVNSRAEAFKTLTEVARFFRKSEPHSPVSYALEQVVKWGKMSLPDLLTELIRDSSARESMFRHVGISESDQAGNSSSSYDDDSDSDDE